MQIHRKSGGCTIHPKHSEKCVEDAVLHKRRLDILGRPMLLPPIWFSRTTMAPACWKVPSSARCFSDVNAIVHRGLRNQLLEHTTAAKAAVRAPRGMHWAWHPARPPKWPAYQSQERRIGTAMVVNERQDDWDAHLPRVALAYNNSVGAATALAPNEVHMNRLPRLPLTVFEHPPLCSRTPVPWWAIPVQYSREFPRWLLPAEMIPVQYSREFPRWLLPAEMFPAVAGSRLPVISCGDY